MADVYLLFTDPLAQAIAEGRKTVTRRPITKRNTHGLTFCYGENMGQIGGLADLDWDAHLISSEGRPTRAGASPHSERCTDRRYCCSLIDGDHAKGGYLHVPAPDGETRHRVYCRYSPGDTLIVRETWQRLNIYPNGYQTFYRAAWQEHTSIKPKWRPSIHMKRAIARSVRRITSVRPELLGPLDQSEAEREGFESPEAFAAAWVAIYGDKVRWVWRIEFEARNEA